MCPSSCCTRTTAASTSSAETTPSLARATTTATKPVTVAPTIGTKAPKNTRTPSGIASGTPMTATASPMKNPSTKAMRTVPRTYPVSTTHDRVPASRAPGWARSGSSETSHAQIRGPS